MEVKLFYNDDPEYTHKNIFKRVIINQSVSSSKSCILNRLKYWRYYYIKKMQIL